MVSFLMQRYVKSKICYHSVIQDKIIADFTFDILLILLGKYLETYLYLYQSIGTSITRSWVPFVT